MTVRSPSFRVYHAALLEYVHGSGEAGLAHAYDLGRSALAEGAGLLHVVRVHEEAAGAIIESIAGADEIRRCVKFSAAFLIEALSPFEMVFHGYAAGNRG